MEHVFDVTNGRMQHRETAQGQPEAGMDQHVEAIDLGGTAAILSKVPLFAGMDRARLKLLAFTSERVSCAIGDVVFRQADAGDKAYVVLDGQVEVIVESQAGDTVVATIGRHQIFGEMALLASRPRTDTTAGPAAGRFRQAREGRCGNRPRHYPGADRSTGQHAQGRQTAIDFGVSS
jgi:hypothetical protein